MIKNILNRRFGRLLVTARADNRVRKNSGPLAYWVCLCDCGSVVEVSGLNLRQNAVLSCGCFQKEITVENSTRHGHARRFKETDEYQMWIRAKRRARNSGVRFDLQISDIGIPELCPVLGIKLQRGDSASQASSPSLDRLIPERGYVKGNVRVISHKANTIKNNATTEELEKVLAYSYGSEVFAYA